MSELICFQVDGYQETLSPKTFITALRYFTGILRELDSAITNDPKGTVFWSIELLSKQSPATVGFRGYSSLIETNPIPKIQHDCIKGINLLTTEGERLPTYSNAVMTDILHLTNLQRTRRKDRLSLIKVYKNGHEAIIDSTTRENTQLLMEGAYESESSIVGNLDSITIHSGNEFRVWEEITGYAVTCRFPKHLLQSVKDALGNRVLVYGDVKRNHRGQPILINVHGFESYTEESKLPTIEEMSGLVDDFTDGLSLKEYLGEIRSG